MVVEKTILALRGYFALAVAAKPLGTSTNQPTNESLATIVAK